MRAGPHGPSPPTPTPPPHPGGGLRPPPPSMVTPARILMGPPDYYGIRYEINRWMHLDHPADPGRATAQWRSLRAAVADLPGVEVVEIAPQPDLPDLVFTANGGLHVDQRVVVGTFRHRQRQGETAYFAAWFAAHGFTVVTPPDGLVLEGAGDVVRTATGWIAGYPQRSNAAAHRWLAQLLGDEVLSVELIDPRYYHLDTCLVVLGETSAACVAEAFDAYGLAVLRERFADLIEVAGAEGERFACNLVAWAGHAILPAGCPRLRAALAERGWTTTAVEAGEFLKAGGACRCLCLTLPESATVVAGLAPAA